MLKALAMMNKVFFSYIHISSPISWVKEPSLSSFSCIQLWPVVVKPGTKCRRAGPNRRIVSAGVGNVKLLLKTGRCMQAHSAIRENKLFALNATRFQPSIEKHTRHPPEKSNLCGKKPTIFS